MKPMSFASCLPPLVAVLLLSFLAEAADTPVNSFTIRADWFDRGNIRVSTPGEAYAEEHACIWSAGPVPNQSEYDVDFPVTADYTMLALYTAQSSRPVDIYLDGKRIHQGFAGVTGSWQTSGAKWERQCTMRVTRGRHTIKLIAADAYMPHICAFRFESPLPFGQGWKLDRAVAQAKTKNTRPKLSSAHLIPELPLLRQEDCQLEVEVMRAEEYVSGGPTANNELLHRPEDADLGTTAWVARLLVRSGDQQTEEARVNLSPQRLRRMLRHTLQLIDDFRTIDGVDADFLGPERSECAQIVGELPGILREPESRQKWERFGRTYLAVSRIEQRVALRNPLLDFDRLLLVDHNEKDLDFKYGNSQSRCLPMNYEGNSSIAKTGYDDQLAVLSPVRPGGKITTLWRPERGEFVGDVDLHFDATRMLFSMPGENGRWQIFQLRADGSALGQLPLIEDPAVDNYDACYLPDGNVLFTSSACFTGVPCVGGAHHVANLYRLNTTTGKIRRLTFEQDHDWCPTVLNNGRVLYTRWEYSDLPHYASRILFHMNPDGTGQMEYYGSNSYWPTAMFFARPVPNHPTKFVAVISGHHGVPRMGELVLFDPAKGRREADGAIQRIPGCGKTIEPIIIDQLADESWPKFLHPYPLSDKYFIVSARPSLEANWGIYLADVFDNMVLLKEVNGRALLEPIPLCKTNRPPLIPDKVEPDRRDAVISLTDVYAGEGLKGVPRGTVKRLRLVTYHFAYQGMGGQQNRVGLDGPWDIKRVLGTVPVEPDGSAVFRVPANTPISVQPLDSEGKALQLMRSWMTAMPGEVLSCVGCHEKQNTAPPVKRTIASGRPPSEITRWYGPPRGFSFKREVQPVLDQYCVGCHNGRPRPDGQTIPDLRHQAELAKVGTKYTPSYWALRRLVRTTTIEGDMHLLPAYEYHADTTELIQMLSRGHHNVQLDHEAWDRLITWIDLHAPAHGTWHELLGRPVTDMRDRRRAMMQLYASGRDEDPEAIPDMPERAVQAVLPEPSLEPAAEKVACPGWPFDTDEAKRRQAVTAEFTRTIDLGGGVTLQLVLIPAGQFVMGGPGGHPNERPSTQVTIERPFWMGKFEVTNEQFGHFAPSHDSRLEPGDFIQLGVQDRGYPVNLARQPVVRVSWEQAMAFCRWLSAQTGRRFTLPSEAQWEYACRAGTETPLWYGAEDRDFSALANLADASLKHVEAFEPFGFPASCVPPWRPAVEGVNDEHRVSAAVGTYLANPWGLYDMHGNVAEWTRTAFRLYSYSEEDGRNDVSAKGRRVVRGGSWYDRPKRARSAFRLAYWPYQGVYHVGFRVVCEATEETSSVASFGHGFDPVVFIRHTNSTGDIDFVASSGNTPDEPNAKPMIAPTARSATRR